jgi:tetratricopeptide (TPR) repeat protein
MIENLIRQGLQHHREGRLDEAKTIYDQVLKISTRNPDALHLRGLIALQEGDAKMAVEYIRQATQLQPKNWAFKGNLAAALMELGAIDEALSVFRRAARLKPDNAQFQTGVANCLALRGEIAQAEKQLRAVTQRFPGFALAWFNLANTVRDQGRAPEALDLYRRAIAVDSSLVEAFINLGGTLLSLGRLDEAEATYHEAIAISPHDPRLHCNLASVLIDRGRHAAAEAACRIALQLAPEFALAHAFIAAAIGHQGRLHEALDYHRKAAALEPQNARVQTALGAALFEIGETVAGMRTLEHALSIAPNMWEAHFSMAVAKLTVGEFAAGWHEFLYRPTRARFMRLYPDIVLAAELPADLSGRHVAVHREQGLGDQLFFLRYAVAVKARGARITYRPAGKIAGILKRVAAIDCVIDESEPLPPADYTLLVSDLPAALAASDGTAAVAPPLQLAPLPEQLADIRTRLAEAGPPPYIGLTWRGGTAPEDQRAVAWMLFKEIPLAEFGASMREVNGTLLALQRNPAAGEIAQLSAALGRPLHDFSALNDDLEAMLALLALIDDYVGVSNTNMHLRAGLGKHSRVLVPCPPEWRWMASGNESPWFPGFGVYRQKNDGDWGEALTRLAHDLQTMFPRGSL